MSSSHRVLAASLAVVAACLSGAAQAQPSAADIAAVQAQAALSARYAQLWQALDADARLRLSAAERHWLAVTRWQEQRRCVEQAEDASAAATTGGQAASADRADMQLEDRESQCLAAVTMRRVQALASTAVAAR